MESLIDLFSSLMSIFNYYCDIKVCYLLFLTPLFYIILILWLDKIFFIILS